MTNASEFVEACHSYKGVKGVCAFDCRIVKNDSKKKYKYSIKQITNYYNFAYQSNGLLVHRCWNIGSGLLIPRSQLSSDQMIAKLISSHRSGFVHDWVQTREKFDDAAMDVGDCDEQEEDSSQTCDRQKTIYGCDVAEGCTAEFMKFGNYLNHIIIGNHRLTVEKSSMKDTAMKIYHSKLEKVENRRIISLDMSLTQMIDDEPTVLSRGWALPIRKANTEFSPKQRTYLRKKFDEGVSGVKYWKPKEVVLDMDILKENGKFYFKAREILSENQIRSYFSRLKRERQLSSKQQASESRVFTDDSEEVDSELETLEQELQEIEMAVEENTVLEKWSINAKTALKSSLSLNASTTKSTMPSKNK